MRVKPGDIVVGPRGVTRVIERVPNAWRCEDGYCHRASVLHPATEQDKDKYEYWSDKQIDMINQYIDFIGGCDGCGQRLDECLCR